MNRGQWRLQDAKAQFSQVVDAALHGEPQHVTKHGREAVVVLSEASYQALKASARLDAPRFVDHLLSIPKSKTTSEERESIRLREVEL